MSVFSYAEIKVFISGFMICLNRQMDLWPNFCQKKSRSLTIISKAHAFEAKSSFWSGSPGFSLT